MEGPTPNAPPRRPRQRFLSPPQLGSFDCGTPWDGGPPLPGPQKLLFPAGAVFRPKVLCPLFFLLRQPNFRHLDGGLAVSNSARLLGRRCGPALRFFSQLKRQLRFDFDASFFTLDSYFTRSSSSPFGDHLAPNFLAHVLSRHSFFLFLAKVMFPDLAARAWRVFFFWGQRNDSFSLPSRPGQVQFCSPTFSVTSYALLPRRTSRAFQSC